METIGEGLKALQYSQHTNFDLSKNDDLVSLVCWLEDRKIRQLEVATRSALRKYSNTWDTEFAKYLECLGCPFSWEADSLMDCICWLVSHAVALEYEDGNFGGEESCDVVPDGSGSDESELSSKINELGKLVNMNRLQGEDDPDYLKRISRTIKLFFSTASHAHQQQEFSLASFPLGFDCGDAIVNKIALVLKMLHLFEYRELQNDLNALIVLGQEFTANPRTNNVLGKVGR